MRVEYQATNPAARAILSKLAATNTIYDKVRPTLEKEVSAKLGRPVVLLAGNFVKQKKGVVSYHGSVPMPGAVFLARKGYDAKTGIFYMWVVVK